MFECAVQLYGFPKAIADRREVVVTLTDGANLADVIAQLRVKQPTLEGFAIMPGENRLSANFKINHNGRLVYTDFSATVHSGDHIALLIPVSGG
jgi:molybdopterin converting factor small subunit